MWGGSRIPDRSKDDQKVILLKTLLKKVKWPDYFDEIPQKENYKSVVLAH